MSTLAHFRVGVGVALLLTVASVVRAQIVSSQASSPWRPPPGNDFVEARTAKAIALDDPSWVRKLVAEQGQREVIPSVETKGGAQPLVRFPPEPEMETIEPSGKSELRFAPPAPPAKIVSSEEHEASLAAAEPRPQEHFISHSADSLYIPAIPNEFTPWWQKHAVRSLRPAQPIHLDVETIVLNAMMHSHHIKAINKNYAISRTAIAEAAGAFDAHAFTESKFINSNEPVGNTLTTGGPSRLLSNDWGLSGGVRTRTQWGGSFELSQRVGLQDSNSVFFLPANQGNARLSLSFSQPLLSGAGRAYNESLILLAKIETGTALAQISQQLQEHLVEVNRAYWDLYLQRAAVLQKQRCLERAETILKEAESRQGLDTLRSQLLRSRAAVSGRRAELMRARAATENAEARIRALTNAPYLASLTAPELIPVEPPAAQFIETNVRDALTTALQNRPEIEQSMRQIRAANVRLDVSESELLPALNFIVDSYVSGLQGNSDISGAYGDQFSTGAPGFTAGLIFDMPLNNRAARARNLRRKLELQQLTDQLQATLQLLSAEVEVAVREVSTTFAEMRSGREALVAMQAEEDYLFQRWQNPLPGDERSAGLALDDLLGVQERLAAQEFNYAKSQVNYSLALLELKRATGTLLRYESIDLQETYEPQPTLFLENSSPNDAGARLVRLPQP